MKKNSRVLLYILLNIIISAATVLIVLWIWERTHTTLTASTSRDFLPLVEQINGNSSSDPANEDSDPTNALTFVTEDVKVVIHSIVGADNLEVEYVEIHNQSQGSLDMTNWQLSDQNGNVFTFPALILNEGGAIKVLSKPGNDTVIELYWQSDAPIWQSGETAKLLSAEGNIVSTYSIP